MAVRTPREQFVRLESPDLFQLFTDTRDFDRKLYAQLRRAMRDAADPIVSDVRAEIGQIPSSGKYRTGVRAALAAGTNASLSASSGKSAGVTIRTSTRRLPASKRSLGKAFNQASFRHPVFAHRGLLRNRGGIRWVQQQGHPYFGGTVAKHWDDVQQRLADAFWRATDDLHAAKGI